MTKMWIIILLFCLAIPIGFLGWISFTTPHHSLEERVSTSAAKDASFSDTLLLMSWNIGYAGLGEGMDFFFDGGRRVKDSRERTQENLGAIMQELTHHEDVDIFLFQEVDAGSARSYYQNQRQEISRLRPQFSASFAPNYEVAYVPVPFRNPMGRVSSGVLTLSRTQPVEATRIRLPGRDAWPKRLFLPDRCLLVTRFKLFNNRNLLVINLHNSAYDEGGKQREAQVAFLKNLVLDAFLKGDYVIVGGDWNQSPADFRPENTVNGDTGFIASPVLENHLFPGWSLAWDAHIPTNRNLDSAYVRGVSGTTIIDYFLCSPNIEVLENKTLDLHFRHSDHQPVLLKIELKD